MKTISLEFDGYWREAKKEYLPEVSGIYCVYACTYNPTESTVSLRTLLYVGESDDVRERLVNHERLQDWKRLLRGGETLCYSVAEVSSNDRVRAEAAVIFRHKPPCNTEYKNRFPFENTVIKTSGKNKFLDAEFTVFTKW